MKYAVLTILVAVLAAGPAAGEPCYSCVAKACYEDFTLASGLVDEQLEELLGEVEQEVAAMSLPDEQRAEVQRGTEKVLRGNAERRKRSLFDGLKSCLESG